MIKGSSCLVFNAGTSVESGAKIAISCVNGYVFLNHFDWNNFNESIDLLWQIDCLKRRFGHYPVPMLTNSTVLVPTVSTLKNGVVLEIITSIPLPRTEHSLELNRWPF
jgi:hypothetical protein